MIFIFIVSFASILIYQIISSPHPWQAQNLNEPFIQDARIEQSNNFVLMSDDFEEFYKGS